MTESSLRDALEKLAEKWARMDCRVDLPENAQWGAGVAQGYSNSAADLLRELAAHPAAEPVGVSDEAVERLAGKLHGLEHDRLHSRCPGSDECQLWYDAEFRAQWLFAEGLLAAPLMGATPARPTRAQIMRALYEEGAYCGDCEFESAHVTPDGFTVECNDCDRVLNKYADAVLALMGGAE